MAKLDLTKVAFGAAGSRHMVIETDGKLWLSIAPDGGGALFGGAAARAAGLLELSLVNGSQDIPYTYETDGFSITLTADGTELRFVIDADAKAVRIEGNSNATLRLDGKNPGGTTLNTGSAADITIGGSRYYLVAKSGSYSFDDTWVLNAFGSVRAIYDLTPNDGKVELYAYNLEPDTDAPEITKPFDVILSENKSAYAAFEAKLVDVSAEYAELKSKVAYSLWTSYRNISETADAVVADRLSSPAVIASEQAVAALAFKDTETAAKLIVSAEKSYPPIAGLAAAERVKEFPRKLLIAVNRSLTETAEWWLKYRHKDGKFFYAYRYETGLKNPQAFRAGEAVESPDLYAYLYLLFKAVSECNAELCNTYSATVWQERADAISASLSGLSSGTKFVAKSVNTGDTTEVEPAVSLLALLARLPIGGAVETTAFDAYKYEVSEPTIIDALCGGFSGDTDNAIIGAALLWRASLGKGDK